MEGSEEAQKFVRDLVPVKQAQAQAQARAQQQIDGRPKSASVSNVAGAGGKWIDGKGMSAKGAQESAEAMAEKLARQVASVKLEIEGKAGKEKEAAAAAKGKEREKEKGKGKGKK